jgi:murein DD-endopeptidase MepM/ murein hydrolase activator NlpD
MRRRVAGAGALAVVAGAAALALATRQPPRPSPCADAAEQLAGVWDDARRDTVRTAVRRIAAPGATAALDRAVAAIDRYAAEWAAIRGEACEATLVRHEQSAALRDLRMACLDRARIQLRALGDALAAGDADTVRGAAAAAAALPALDACSDAEALRAIVSPPLNAAARTQIQAAAGGMDEPHVRGDPEVIVVDAPASWPDFRLPFGCGEAWQIADHAYPRHHGAQIDLAVPGGESSAGFAVFAVGPGWVSRVVPENGEVDIDHGNGWSTTYQHMTDLRVALHRYVGRGQVIGRVGNVNVKNSLGRAGPAHLHYEQVYEPAAANPGSDRPRDRGNVPLYLERQSIDPELAGGMTLTSTNNCSGGGVPGSVVQYDVPGSTAAFSPTRQTLEILTRRAEDHALFERWYDRGWNGAVLPHTIAGRPAVAVFGGQLHAIARKSSGAIFDLRYDPFTGWQTTYLEGRVSDDPAAVVYGWNHNLHVAARGSDGLLYLWWMGETGAWSHAMRVDDVPVVGTPALVSHYDAFYIVARAGDGALWSWEADRRGLWTASRLPGAASSDPDATVDPRSGLVNVVARGSDGRIYRWQSKDPDRSARHASAGWSDPELVDAGHRVIGAPAATLYHGAMHVFARGPDSAVYHWWKADTWQWEAIAGSYTGDPDVAGFGDQLQTVGRGVDGDLHTIWYDPLTGLWNPEDQGVQVTD